MPKKVLLTDKEVETLKDVISFRGEEIEKTIVEDERQGADLAICKDEIACLEGIHKKLIIRKSEPKMKLYYIEKVSLAMIGGTVSHYLLKAKTEKSALRKVGIESKQDEEFGVIEELRDDVLQEKNLLKGALLCTIEQ